MPRGMPMLTLLLLSVFPALSLSIRLSKWTRLQNYPAWVSESQGTHIGYHSYGARMLLCGGFKNFPSVTKECYTRSFTGPANEPWKKVAPLRVGVTHMAQVSYGNTFCGAGGFIGAHPGKSVKYVYCYNVRTNKWKRLPDLPAPRAGGGLTLWRKGAARLLIFAGGVNRPFNKLAGQVDHSDTWVLDLSNLKKGWVDQKASMPDPRNHMAAVNVCGKYFWVGGQHKEDEKTGNRRTVAQYLPWKKQWVNKAPIPIPGGLGHISASVVPYKCGFFVIGGTTANVTKMDKVLYYNASTDKWAFISTFPRKVATPVCGLRKGFLICGTGGGIPKMNNAVYRARVYA